MKTTERNMLNILLAILLIISVGICVHSCIKSQKDLENLEQIRDNEIQIIIKQ